MGWSRERLKQRLAGFVGGYKAVALIVLNTLILFILLNILCFVGLKLLHRGGAGPETAWDRALNASFHNSDLSEIQQNRLMEELRAHRIEFEPFTNFRGRDARGQYLNVRQGIRNLEEGCWPPRKENFNIFVFGGSTTFGAASDTQTIPAYLEEVLRETRQEVKVFNFGRVYYYSTQERILFEQLLLAGHAPRVAIFVDGLNDFYHVGMDVPFRERLQQAFETKPRMPPIPVVKVYRVLTGADQPVAESYDQSPEALRAVIDRYLVNKKLIEAAAQAFGTIPVFVWQPVPTYKLESKEYPFVDRDLGRHVCSRQGYLMMAERVGQSGLGDDFLWLADLQQGFKEPIYMDVVHYTPSFSKAIARAIGGFLVERKIVPPAGSK